MMQKLSFHHSRAFCLLLLVEYFLNNRKKKRILGQKLMIIGICV